jgi:hypothetical protein
MFADDRSRQSAEPRSPAARVERAEAFEQQWQHGEF